MALYAPACGSTSRSGKRAGKKVADHSPFRLQLTGISKSYPGVLANDDVSLSVKPGEIHALLGENGAGKSTLVKIIYGLQQPESGEIRLDGKALTIASPRAARALGIGMVFQHFSLFEPMTVLENIALGMDRPGRHSDLERKITGLLAQYGLSLDPHRVVSTLSVGERQRVEIVRALLLQPSLLIMDEPTSVLTPQEVEQLFGTLRQLAESGCSILYISHKLAEVKALCSSATILRGGRVVTTCDPRSTTAAELAEMMIGRKLEVTARVRENAGLAPKFTVSNLSLSADEWPDIRLSDIAFDVASGEIFGIAGIAGNGQAELFQALAGELPAAGTGSISLNGRDLGKMGPVGRRRHGLCAVPEERIGHSAVLNFSLSDNTVLTARHRKKMMTKGFLRRRAPRYFAREVINAFNVRTSGTRAGAATLSGGNLQKFVVGREILQSPEVLIVSQPTWGVDAGAAAAIHNQLMQLAANGAAVVVISQDLDELLALCDRISVINRGSLSEAMPVDQASIERLGLLMGGVTDSDPIAGGQAPAISNHQPESHAGTHAP